MLPMVVTAPVSQLVMSALKAEALRNMESILVTAVVFHLLPSVLMALLNFAAPLNISLMSVTAFVSQSLMSWLNSTAPLNMLAMVVTAPVSQLVMSASKSVVPPPPENISDILVTAVVFHLLPSVLMALLNFFAPLNMELMSVTAFVSQSLMSGLNLSAPMNISFMLVTAAVFHLLPSVLMA